jgi:hypothetical protein
MQLNVVLSFVCCVWNTGQPARWHPHARRDTVCSLLDVGGTWAGLVQWVTSEEKKKRKAIDSWMGRGMRSEPDCIAGATHREGRLCTTHTAVVLACNPLVCAHGGWSHCLHVHPGTPRYHAGTCSTMLAEIVASMTWFVCHAPDPVC